MPSSSALLLLVIGSCVLITAGRVVNSPDQLMPFIFSSVHADESSVPSSPNGPSRLIQVIEQIIKYVSSIKSSEHFIENIVNRHKDVADKMKVLTFLNKCFEITHNVIQHEIDRMLSMPSTAKKSSSVPSPFTLEELQQAQIKINDLLVRIGKRIATLKTWIPPTMPFLGFF